MLLGRLLSLLSGFSGVVLLEVPGQSEHTYRYCIISGCGWSPETFLYFGSTIDFGEHNLSNDFVGTDSRGFSYGFSDTKVILLIHMKTLCPVVNCGTKAFVIASVCGYTNVDNYLLEVRVTL